MSNFDTYILRDQPLLEFTLYQDNFKVINDYNKNHNGTYSFKDLKKMTLVKKGVNWLMTILSYLSIINTGTTLKDRDRLVIKLKSKNLDILLTNCNLENTQKLTNNLKSKLN